MGFTAINVGQAARPQDAGAEPHAPRTRAAAKNNDVQRAVSEYLGRGRNEVSASINEVLHGPETRKATTQDRAGQGKKRAGQAKVSTKNKSRKLSDVLDGLQVTKSNTRTSSRSLKQIDVDETGDHQSTTFDDRQQTISVYAPLTSMSVLNDPTPQNSMSTLKATNERRATLYRRAPSGAQAGSGVSFAEPVINQQLSKQRGSTVRREMRSREKEGAQSSEQVGQRLGVDSIDDFMDDDFDEDDIMALTEAMEQNHEDLPVVDGLDIPTQTTSDAMATSDTPTEHRSEPPRSTPILVEDEDMLHDEYHEILSDAISAGEEPVRERDDSLQARDRKLNIREVHDDGEYEEALLSEAERQLLAKLKTSSSRDGPRPMVRLPFPHPVQDRSPIYGASPATTLKTCFRIGEALKEGTRAVRANQNAVLELFARVTYSWREGRQQHFAFKDLYHDNPPHLKGTFELWSQSRLWDADSYAFIVPKKDSKMCRLIGRLRRGEMEWRLEVLSIWEAGWEDVEFAAGIHGRKYGLPGV